MKFLQMSLAAWRLTSLLVAEEGPFRVLERLRTLSFFLNGPLDCFWCTSVWVAVFLVLAGRKKLVLWLALSAAAIFLDEFRQLLSEATVEVL